MKDSKLEIQIFTEAYSDKLYRGVKVTRNVDNYYQPKFPYEERHPKGRTGIFLDSSFSLDPSKSDAENSIALYNELKLNETQASDPRLWVYLTHVVFWEYMRTRWPLEGVRKGSDPVGRVIDRYLMTNANLESLTRNGISRLWWYAHLTKDPKRKDEYELTKVLLKRAEIAVGIMERIVGSNRNTRIGVLEFLMENENILNDEELTRKLLKSFNLYGGTKILPIFPISEIKKILNAIRPAA